MAYLRNYRYVSIFYLRGTLNSLQDLILETRSNLLTLLLRRGLTVESQQSTQVEFWLFQQLDLSDVNVLQWEDVLCSLLNFTANNLWDQLGGELSQGGVLNLSVDDLGHLLSDGSDVRRLSVGGLLDLVSLTLGECNSKDSDDVIVGGLSSDVALNQRLPLSNHGSELVRGHVHTVEVGEQVVTLNLVNSQLDVSEGVVLRTL